ncbi:hypothetical protein H5410_038551 [Solanum commersonii]|uniref:Uncharacterized protein n=1 Tax=Solanum commersonii TaxID=4109 RepID=A0A9J5YBP0_SOLCO|nr:hypothetical protein H5410_038551 [Solanum commersonii]
MIAEQRLFASSQISWYLNGSYLNSTAGLSTSWTNRPFWFDAESTYGLSLLTPILLSGINGNKYHFCGFCCNSQSVECLSGSSLHSRTAPLLRES